MLGIYAARRDNGTGSGRVSTTPLIITLTHEILTGLCYCDMGVVACLFLQLWGLDSPEERRGPGYGTSNGMVEQKVR